MNNTTSKRRITEIGVFKSEDGLERKQLPLMANLCAYYTPEVLRRVLLPIISHTGKQDRISLRALDWLVTNYCKKHPIMYMLKHGACGERVINMYTEYKAWLSKYRRTHFDPFRRKHKLTFSLDGQVYATTVGQLNFMYWASRYGVIAYATTHIEVIEQDHACTMKAKQEAVATSCGGESTNKKKRRQLSQAPCQKVLLFADRVSVGFQPRDAGVVSK
jgi:hypothetical protein